jgi:hypothetical protein
MIIFIIVLIAIVVFMAIVTAGVMWWIVREVMNAIDKVL